jgi:hypothetical protein
VLTELSRLEKKINSDGNDGVAEVECWVSSHVTAFANEAIAQVEELPVQNTPADFGCF